MNCRQNFPKHHWPYDQYKKEDFKNSYYNVIVYELNDSSGHYYVAITSDACGMTGHGDTIEEALNELTKIIECVIEETNPISGLFPDTSDFEYQNQDMKSLEDDWKSDNIEILNKSFHVIYLYDMETE